MTIIEAKGRRAGADAVTVTRNEILTGLNKPDQYILALVEVEEGKAQPARYVREPFTKEPDFGVTSVNYDLRELLTRSNELFRFSIGTVRVSLGRQSNGHERCVRRGCEEHGKRS